MLKKFLLNTLSSFVGTWIAIICLVIAAIMTIVALVGNMALSSSGDVEQVKKGSILKIELTGGIEEREANSQPNISMLMNGDMSMPQSLEELTAALKEAADNKNIVALYLECGPVAASPATLNALRHEILEFKKSGKKIYAYGDSYTLGSYYVASVADRIYLNPYGEMSIKGLGSMSPYMKGLFDKLGIQFQVVKVGTFKSAVEPYIMENMSEPARAQLDTLFGDMWNYISDQIAASRKDITAQKFNALVSDSLIAVAPAELAQSSGLVDSLIYGREIKSRLALLAGKPVEKLNIVSPSTLVSQLPWASNYNSKNRIAVLYACGDIEDGSSTGINFETLVPEIVKLADDDDVKGMVLRVNSPGGSVFGSSQIGEALDYFRSKGKPLAVSMGDYAASGGYWISSCADKIFADPLTVTGSIGIFGMIPEASGALSKIGVNPQMVSTNPQANFPSLVTPMTEEQKAAMQANVNRGYEQFTGRVAKGRHMKIDAVKRIAEGRVWSAMTAQKIGLVDSLAYLQDAIEWTAKEAKVASKYDVAAYPQLELNIWSVLRSSGYSVSKAVKAVVEKDPTMIATEYAERILRRNRVQARMPEVYIYM
jgi:protease-4